MLDTRCSSSYIYQNALCLNKPCIRLIKRIFLEHQELLSPYNLMCCYTSTASLFLTITSIDFQKALPNPAKRISNMSEEKRWCYVCRQNKPAPEFLAPETTGKPFYKICEPCRAKSRTVSILQSEHNLERGPGYSSDSR